MIEEESKPEKRRRSPIMYPNAQRRVEILRDITQIVAPFGLSPSFMPGPYRGKLTMNVGVVGDQRAYTPVIILKGSFPGYDTLAKLSSEIGNTQPITRITYDMTPTIV